MSKPYTLRHHLGRKGGEYLRGIARSTATGGHHSTLARALPVTRPEADHAIVRPAGHRPADPVSRLVARGSSMTRCGCRCRGSSIRCCGRGRPRSCLGRSSWCAPLGLPGRWRDQVIDGGRHERPRTWPPVAMRSWRPAVSERAGRRSPWVLRLEISSSNGDAMWADGSDGAGAGGRVVPIAGRSSSVADRAAAGGGSGARG